MKLANIAGSNRRVAATTIVAGAAGGAVFALVASLLVSPRSSLLYIAFWALCLASGVALAVVCMRLVDKATTDVMSAVAESARESLGIAGIDADQMGEDLVRSFQEVAKSLNQAHHMSTDLKQYAAEVLAATEQQASSAAQQAAAVAQTSATIEELAQTSKQIADNSEAVAETAERTLASAHEGMQSLEETAAGIEEIRETTRLSSDRILELGERSQEIGRVLVIIDDIAEQTKILALNAAIEAARAGDAGKGFAVVAEEIRKLAESVTRSTQDIGRVVHEIQASAGSLVMATERAQQKVEEGKDLAHRTAEALFRIVNQVGETTTSAKQISMATQQQRSASDQVVVSMREMAQVSTTAAQASRQIQSSIADLTKLADTIRVR